MTVEQTISSISALPVEDQLRIVQAVWDHLPADVGTPLTDQQRAELDRRWEAYRNNPASGLTEEQLRAELRDARP
jgi:putative addiction module component (TIGR02574 family)